MGDLLAIAAFCYAHGIVIGFAIAQAKRRVANPPSA